MKRHLQVAISRVEYLALNLGIPMTRVSHRHVELQFLDASEMAAFEGLLHEHENRIRLRSLQRLRIISE